MKQIDFLKTDWDTLQELTAAYFAELGHKNDSFYNGHIFSHDAYRIALDGATCGFFSYGDSWESGKMLFAFYLIPAARNASTAIFRKLIEEMDVSTALVASNDSLFVSLAFETMHAQNASFEMRAYNFTYGEPSRPAEYKADCLVEVQPDEYETMNRLTEGQWDGCFGDPDYAFYALRHEGATLGYGAIGRMKYNEKFVDVGNFTLPEHRQQGVGRSLIIHLSQIALRQGFTPVAGCWYRNQESVMTLISSGYMPENRIFFVRLKAQ